MQQRKQEIGLDDAGRGTIAGPLVLAALWHPEPRYLQAIGAKDSKKTTATYREAFIRKLDKDDRGIWGLGAAPAEWINQLGTDNAEASSVMTTLEDLILKIGDKLGMVTPWEAFTLKVDGNKSFPNLPPELEVEYLPKGDGYVPVISAASILAKATHEKLMVDLGQKFPGWGLETNFGKDTEVHLAKLYTEGLQPFHRTRAAKTSVCTYALKRGLPFPDWVGAQ